MKILSTLILFCAVSITASTQIFTRTILPTHFTTPWEIVYGPDNYLWLTDSGGMVVRVEPVTGSADIIYTADDYFAGSPSEQLDLCFQPSIGHGTLGLALDPDFLNEDHNYIYYVYSYNSGDAETPVTKFKIVRLTWDPETETVDAHEDLVTDLPTGYDHLGGRLMAIKREGIPYLFFSIGDNGISEDNSPNCYDPQSENPNNFAQDPTHKNGKIHRFNIDGTIPEDNPIPGNSFYTRGHRNPQGLAYNPELDILYEIEHGDRIDDEINILDAGMNYGWKDVRGYMDDNNYPGEAEFIANYVANPDIPGDALKEPLYSWCATTPSNNDDFLSWCTVAPSDGFYYGSTGAISEWQNSVLVVTLKNGDVTDNQLYVFRLNADGVSLEEDVIGNPNPHTYFAEDQELNGRLRDITVSPDGSTIYMINNNDNMEDKIIVYTLDASATNELAKNEFRVFPNPVQENLTLPSGLNIHTLSIYNADGKLVEQITPRQQQINVTSLGAGIYTAHIRTNSGETMTGRFIKE